VLPTSQCRLSAQANLAITILMRISEQRILLFEASSRPFARPADRAEPARRRHRLARRPGAGADPARADTRPARRRNINRAQFEHAVGRPGRQIAVGFHLEPRPAAADDVPTFDAGWPRRCSSGGPNIAAPNG